jgi:hypothetical protein
MTLRSVMTGVAALAMTAFVSTTAHAQINQDWAVFCVDENDPDCVETCDVVTGSNQDFVVLFDSGYLTTLSGTVLTDIVVDLSNSALPVTFQGEPFGFLDFRTDADGFDTLFWLSLTDTVVGIDSFTSEPFDSDRFTSQITGTLCDACSEVDSSLCDDGGSTNDPLDDALNLCGAGLLDALASAIIAFPVLGFVSSRRRRV